MEINVDGQSVVCLYKVILDINQIRLIASYLDSNIQKSLYTFGKSLL